MILMASDYELVGDLTFSEMRRGMDLVRDLIIEGYSVMVERDKNCDCHMLIYKKEKEN